MSKTYDHSVRRQIIAEIVGLCLLGDYYKCDEAEIMGILIPALNYYDKAIDGVENYD